MYYLNKRGTDRSLGILKQLRNTNISNNVSNYKNVLKLWLMETKFGGDKSQKNIQSSELDKRKAMSML